VYNRASIREDITLPTRTVVVFALTLLCCLTASLNLLAQAGGDVTDQIKQLQQDSRDAQMKNDASWAQQHLADGFIAGNSWGDWQTKDEFIKDLQGP
jgi:hypothetical protein